MPRANLSRGVILDQAAQLADLHGYDQLTMAAIAKHFGVAVPSLYKHIASLQAVQRGIAAVALEELTAALQAGTDAPTRRDALRQTAESYRRYAHAHPGRYAAIVRAPDAADQELQERSETLLGIVYGVLAAYGRHGEDAVHDVRTLRAALHGFVSLEAAGGFGMPIDVDRSFARLIDTLDAGFARSGAAAT